jgi:spore coat polysaccharide biosynthesis protein SpsF (cytidylyltransferase family)
MIEDYDILEFQMDCYSFNDIAGKDTQCSLKDIEFQYNLILEETKEIKEKGIDYNNAKEVVDGVVDVMVTALGLMQKLEALGVDMNKAMRDTAYNNLTKYPSDERTAIETAQKYEQEGTQVTVEYNSDYELFVIKNMKDKIMKPIGFESNDLSDCIPADLLKNGFKED